ncbi:metallophosphoesterase [Mesorhizobium sp. M0220]|uniref:metallophosphoesterase n=1 Tax=Mesorhizobium sp. M0220 TaxID=2956920 RepID=UPI00333A7EA7
MLNVFHISDLHFTSRPSGQLRDNTVASVRAILELAEKLRANGTLNSSACIVFTGDLVQSGATGDHDDPSDYAGVQDALLQPLQNILQVTPDRVFIVPGNHEIDRDAVPEGDWLKQGQYTESQICENDVNNDFKLKLTAYFEFANTHGYRSVTFDNPRIAHFEYQGNSIVCLNGLAGAYSRKGYGDKGELFVLGSELANHLAKIKKHAVVLTHHPLSWFADNCGTDLKEFFSSRRCRLLTGHIHDRGIEWIETSKGAFATIQAGASAEVGAPNQVAVAWLPDSDSVAVRHYAFEARTGQFELTKAADTKVAPSKSRDFFERSEAFFESALIDVAAQAAASNSEAELTGATGKNLETFVPPDISYFPEDQFSGRRTSIPAIEKDRNNRVISGDELSGKSSLIHYLSARQNLVIDNRTIPLVLDYRILEAGHDLKESIHKRLTSLGMTRSQAQYILTIGKVELFFDNFDPNASAALAKFQEYFAEYPLLRWTVATRGDQRFMPSRAPASFPREGITYYQLTETTLPTVLKMIENHESGRAVERPRAVVEQVFRSISNLRAPRTIFYVKSMVDVFLTDASVEPLNRYLLIENLLSERIRGAHKHVLPNQPVDMEMLETFIGQIAYRLMERSEPYISKADFYRLVDDFVGRKGIQKKRFDADTVLSILTKSFVLRDYEFGYGFMMLSIEDYFLAKHMGKDENFRSYIMSSDGLLTYPSVAEYYVAQNPSDSPRIEQILALIDEFVDEVAPLVDAIRDSSTAAISGARPGSALALEDELVEMLGQLQAAEDPTSLKFEDPKPVGRTKRVRFAAEERGAVFLQLGASILGVTRTLDQSDRVKIFQRLRSVLLTSLHSLPIIAHHLAEGGEITFRGTSVKADYVGELAVPENRFYLILRGTIYNLFKNFGTWAGSPSFFNAAVQLRSDEENEFVKSALFAQNIEADLSEAVNFIPEVSTDVDSLVIKEILVRLYLDAMTLVPLERDLEARAVGRLVDVTIELKPPSADDLATLNHHKSRLRQSFNERIGFNAYIGRFIKTNKG